jgi:DNA-binding beta-propeller fold protein YncE
MLRIDSDQFDAQRFVRLSGEGHGLLEDGDAGAAAERLRAALALWRGPALADLAYERFAQAEVERLEELRLAALEDRIDADLALGRHGALVGELRECVAEHPLRERLRAQLMAALYRCGRQADALEVYREGRIALSAELGIEPGPTLRELERGILQQDPALGVPAVPPLPVPTWVRRRWLLPVVAVLASCAAAGTWLGTRGDSSSVSPVIVYPHSVAVIDPDRGAIVDDVLVGGYPTALAADDRYVYVVNNGDATVSRIDPALRQVFDTSSFSRATDLIALDGHLWAANGGAPGHTPLGVGPGTILDAGPGSTLRPFRVGPSMDGPEEQTTLAADGPDSHAIWVGNQESRTVREIDPSLGRTVMRIRGIAPGGLAAIGDAGGDTVWASDPTRNLVVRIDETARRVVRRIPVPGRPTRLAASHDAVWVITSGPRASLVRIDPGTNGVVARIPLGITAKRVLLGAGLVWVTGYRWSNGVGRSRGGTVIRVDPHTNRIVQRIGLGDLAADGMVISRGLLWVAVPPSA